MDEFTVCPHCHSNGYYLGPQGGLCIIVECACCGARFNVVILPDDRRHPYRRLTPFFDRELRGPRVPWTPPGITR